MNVSTIKTSILLLTILFIVISPNRSHANRQSSLKDLIIIDTISSSINTYFFVNKNCKDSINFGRFYFVTDSLISPINKITRSSVLKNLNGYFVCFR